MLAFIGRATKDLGPLQVRIEWTDFGGRVAKSVGRSRIRPANRIIHQFAGSVRLVDNPRGKRIAIIISVQCYADADLPKITQALRNPGMLLGAGQSRQKQAGQNGNNGDDH